MVSLTWTVRRAGDVTLVELGLSNDRRRRRVRVESRLRPVWPPRTNGVPEPGWDETGVELVLAPGARRGLGYATPQAPDGEAPPASVVGAEALSADEPAEGVAPAGAAATAPEAEAPAASVVRERGDPRPPRDAVPVAEPGP